VIQRASGNNWYTNWIFCPGYLDGHCQLGEWTARQLWSSTGWFNNGDFEYDYGEAVMNTNNGSTLVDAVGAEGWAYNHPRDQFFHALGYPAEAPFNGERMIECDAPYATDDSPNGVSPAAMGIGCDMTGGSSGGGWLIQFGSARGMVNGHNDYKYDSQPLAMYSPYYGDDWFAVFNSAQQS